MQLTKRIIDAASVGKKWNLERYTLICFVIVVTMETQII
jgi:hypothetical protein